MEMTPEVFWHIVLFTKGNVDKMYSYRVKYWPAMNMAFVKVEKTPRQLARQAERDEQKRKRDHFGEGSYGWGSRGYDWDKGQRQQEKASSSNAMAKDYGWQDHDWENAGWMDFAKEEQGDTSP
eukprot:1907621-Heterocapsa_arctica.AAC.1